MPDVKVTNKTTLNQLLSRLPEGPARQELLRLLEPQASARIEWPDTYKKLQHSGASMLPCEVVAGDGSVVGEYSCTSIDFRERFSGVFPRAIKFTVQLQHSGQTPPPATAVFIPLTPELRVMKQRLKRQRSITASEPISRKVETEDSTFLQHLARLIPDDESEDPEVG